MAEPAPALDRKGAAPRLSAGVSAALMAAVLFGASTPLAKRLVGEMAPVLLAGTLYLGSGLGLLVAQGIRGWVRAELRARARQRKPTKTEHEHEHEHEHEPDHPNTQHPTPNTLSPAEAPLTRADLPWLAGAVFFGGIVGPVLLMVGLRSTSGSTAALLLNLEGVFTALLAWFIFHENYDRRIALGMAAIVAGGLLLSWQGSGGLGLPLGSLAVAGACLCWGIDNNLTQKVSAGDPVQVAAIKGAVAGPVNVSLALLLGSRLPPFRLLMLAGALGFLGYGLSLVLFVLALRQIGTARTGAYFALAPFVGAALSVALLREPVTGQLLGAGVLMGIGIWLHLTERHEHRHRHESLTHTHRHVHDAHHRHRHPPGVDPSEPHTHEHSHAPLTHSHPHYPDIHHRHRHS